MSGKNTEVKIISPKQIIADAKPIVDSSVSFAQGDILILDTSTHLLRAPTAEAECSAFIGIAALDISSGKPLSPYIGTAVDAALAVPALDGPLYGNTYKMVAKTGDAFYPGDMVYAHIATGARGVSVSGTKAIGVYQGKAIASAAAGQEIECLIGARFPNDALKF